MIDAFSFVSDVPSRACLDTPCRKAQTGPPQFTDAVPPYVRPLTTAAPKLGKVVRQLPVMPYRQ